MSRRAKQQEFMGKGFEKPKDCFGGSLLKGNPKTKRPLESKMPIHLVLRGKKGGLRLPKTLGFVNRTFHDTAKKYGVTVYEYANVGNHIHSVLKISRVHRWAPFIREVTGRIGQHMKETLGMDEGFWLFRPYTRIVRGWKKAFQIAKAYVNLNFLQAEGFIDRRQTKTLKDLRAIFGDG